METILPTWLINTIIIRGVRKLVNVPQCNTSFYGTHSITAKSVRDWNNLQKKITFEFNRENVITPKLMLTVKEFFLTSYLDND